MEKINNQELEKIMDILTIKKLKEDTILNLCQIEKLEDLNKKQYNLLLYLLCLR